MALEEEEEVVVVEEAEAAVEKEVPEVAVVEVEGKRSPPSPSALTRPPSCSPELMVGVGACSSRGAGQAVCSSSQVVVME